MITSIKLFYDIEILFLKFHLIFPSPTLVSHFILDGLLSPPWEEGGKEKESWSPGHRDWQMPCFLGS